MNMLDVLKVNTQILNAKLEASKLYTHNGLKGTCREEDLISVIRDCIPECYGMKSGQIFDQYDGISRQIDVVIYDSIFSNFFRKNSSSYLFPCESVYGSIEVKSYLDQKSFCEAIENIKSVRMLKREKSSCLDITPRFHLDLSQKTFKYNDASRNEYINIIFAYDSVSKETLNQYIRNLDDDFTMLPIFIYVHNKGLIYSKVFIEDSNLNSNVENFIPKSYLGMDHEKNNHFVVSEYGENSLTAFFILINAMLEQINLKAIDYTNYCNNSLKELKNNHPDDIIK